MRSYSFVDIVSLTSVQNNLVFLFFQTDGGRVKTIRYIYHL